MRTLIRAILLLRLLFLSTGRSGAYFFTRLGFLANFITFQTNILSYDDNDKLTIIYI